MTWQPIETLPDPDAEYLFWMPPIEEEGAIGMYWTGVLGDWVGEEEDITHWMYLPAPPVENK